MPVLTPNTPLASRTPQISVENRLAAGTYLFRLTVVDEAGNQSAPADLRVTLARVAGPGPTISGPVGPGPTISGPIGPGPTIGGPHVTIRGTIG